MAHTPMLASGFVDYIVTRNIKDFENSEVKVIEPKLFLNLLNRASS